jgi:hypothetical protein
MDWRKSRKALNKTAGLQAKIWTPDIPNMKQECWCDTAYVSVKEYSQFRNEMTYQCAHKCNTEAYKWHDKAAQCSYPSSAFV